MRDRLEDFLQARIARAKEILGDIEREYSELGTRMGSTEPASRVLSIFAGRVSAKALQAYSVLDGSEDSIMARSRRRAGEAASDNSFELPPAASAEIRNKILEAQE